jgi:hypothetical protein
MEEDEAKCKKKKSEVTDEWMSEVTKEILEIKSLLTRQPHPLDAMFENFKLKQTQARRRNKKET